MLHMLAPGCVLPVFRRVESLALASLSQTKQVWERLEGHRQMRLVYRNAAIGAFLGLAVSTIYAVPLVLMYCPDMGCRFSTSLVILGLHAFYWVLGGAFLDSVVGADQLQPQLYTCVEGVRRGGTLMLSSRRRTTRQSQSREFWRMSMDYVYTGWRSRRTLSSAPPRQIDGACLAQNGTD
jgi:hypothetical protein